MQYISAVYVYRGSPPVISAIQSDNIIEARLGIDSHADISCAGKLARIIEVIEGGTCTVHPFNDSMKTNASQDHLEVLETSLLSAGLATKMLMVNDFLGELSNSF